MTAKTTGWLAATGVCLALLSTPASADGLLDAFRNAYLTNPSLEAQRANLRATDENVNQALARGRPSVSVSASAGAGIFQNDTQISQTEQGRTPVSVELRATQPLYRGGANPAAVEQAEYEVLAARAALLQVEQDVMLAAGQAYMNVVRDQAVVDLNKNNESVLRRQLEATRDRFQVGEVTRTDVSQAEARLARATADRRSAEGNLASSQADYEEVVGKPPGFLRQPAALVGLPVSRQEAIDRGTINNPTVIRATFNHLAAAKNVAVAEGDLLPSADLVGRVGYNYETAQEDSTSSNAQALVQVTIPLYSSGSVRSRIRQTKQIASQRLIQIEQARRAAIEEATVGWEQLVATQSRIEALSSEVRAQEIALEGVKQEALVGTRTVLDELDAEQELLNARVNLVQARRDEVVASHALAAAVGMLAAEPLNLDVPRYDVRLHYQAVRSRWLGTDVDSNWQPAKPQQ